MLDNRTVFCALLAIALSAPVFAGEDPFDTQQMLNDLEQQLQLQKQEFDKLKPELESALSNKRKEMEKSVDDAIAKGFVELENMSKQLDAASEQAKKQLEQALNSEQVQELTTFLQNLDKQAIESAYDGLVEELTRMLEISREQVNEIAPVIKETLEKQAELLREFARDSSKKFEEFRRQFQALTEEARARLKDSLQPQQLDKLDQRMDEIRERMKARVFREA